MKAGTVKAGIVPCVMLLALVIAVPAFAKEGRVSHPHRSHGAKAGAGKATGRTATKPGAALRAGEAAEKKPEPAGEPPPVAITAKPHDISIPAKLPPRNETHRMSAPPVPAGRNAIGVTVVPSHQIMVTPPHAGTPAAVTSPKPVESRGEATGPVHPIVTANVGTQGKIGGTNTIRPAVAPAALGGPAKTALGINGTTVRLKHY